MTDTFRTFQRMTRVAVGILRNNGTILVCQRKRGGRDELTWECPGGKLEPGETVEQCLQRELYAELSIRDVTVDRIEVQASEYADGGLFEVAYCHVASFSGTITNNVFEDLRWVTPGELRKMDILEGNHDIVNRLS